ncbi:imipenem/basic amino acid-specific outer membrane pore [Halopseudomonas litoralis]|uniref:Imipenem/basic amino acid-specific outer membrane pore n=1 Tax=Halopseudomonas litoralis TaxID=797277 RepID=A0A1H1QGH6_9GAMM|nr:OprD family porin [Halopseudomonas litoralis]SDS22598.1 imipenem/basic amino acid-specific outer membrane pore [Halopseudomonas litoralis]
MQTFKLGLIAMIMASATAPHLSLANEQSQANGFMEGSSLSLLNKNFLFNRDFRNAAGTRSDRYDWAHGLRASYTSGYTKGAIGIGLDAHSVLTIKLDSDLNGGNTGTGILPVGSDGKAQDDYSYAGAAIKLRASNTELKVGDLIPTAPVFATGSSRFFPGTAQGIQLLSKDIDNLSLDAGHFTSIRDGSMSTNRDGAITLTYGGAVDASSANYLGGIYAFSDNLSATLFGAQLDNVWNQYYTNINYVLPLASIRSMTFDFNLYDTSDTGQALAGNIDNTTWSLSAAYTVGWHTFTAAYQQVDGDEPMDYIGMDGGNSGGSIFLANALQYSDFNGPNEKSYQLRYDLDMAAFGVPGLNLMARYVTGRDIDDSKYDGGANGVYGWYGEDGKHWERDLEAQYTVQSGPAKNLSIRARYATHRANGFDSDVNELRLITQYPLDIF